MYSGRESISRDRAAFLVQVLCFASTRCAAPLSDTAPVSRCGKQRVPTTVHQRAADADRVRRSNRNELSPIRSARLYFSKQLRDHSLASYVPEKLDGQMDGIAEHRLSDEGLHNEVNRIPSSTE
jgi:hypothetical protein